MRNWFPFTDYDFYAYLAAGMLLLFALDYSITGGDIMLRKEWPFIQIVAVVAVAYITGQLVASPSSVILEHWLARRVLHPPMAILVGLRSPRRREVLIQRYLVGRYYEPLPSTLRDRILSEVARVLSVSKDKIVDPEEVFQIAFPVARSVPDASLRMDQFRNLYGFSRNVAFVALVAALSFGLRAWLLPDPPVWWWAAAALVAAIWLFARFLKFYAAFAAEVARTYASKIAQAVDSKRQ